MELPPCGLYRTTVEIDGVPANHLVYFHNHGDPGPGVYLPESWQQNRARFRKQGTTLPTPDLAHSLEALPPEGLYRVLESFHCCEKLCMEFPDGQLVQLGYNGGGEPILFVPRWSDNGLQFPERGQKLSPDRLERMERLKVAREPRAEQETAPPPDTPLH